MFFLNFCIILLGIFINTYITKHSYNSIKELPECHQAIISKQFNESLASACVFHITNHVRSTKKLRQLDAANALMSAAHLHANEMILYNFFNHKNTFVLAHLTFVDRIKSKGGVFDYMSENLAERYTYNIDPTQRYTIRTEAGITKYYFLKSKKEVAPYTYWQLAEALVKQWIDSPQHYKNMMNVELKYLGVGIAVSENNQRGGHFPTVKAVQNFGY